MANVKPHKFGPKIAQAKEYIESAQETIGKTERFSAKEGIQDRLTSGAAALPDERRGSSDPIEEVDKALSFLYRAHELAERNTQVDEVNDAYGDIRMAYELIYEALHEGVEVDDSTAEPDDVEVSDDSVLSIRQKVSALLQ